MPKEKNFIVEYTEKVTKDGEFTGNKHILHFTHSAAQQWVKDNSEILYWNRIRNLKAKSKLPKIVINEAEDLSQYKKITGTLERYFETGMECMGLIINDHSIQGPPNPKFDPSKPEDGHNFKFFGSYESVHFIESGDVLQPEGQPKYYILKDRDFAAEDSYTLSFYPQGFSREELIQLFFHDKIKATVWTKSKK